MAKRVLTGCRDCRVCSESGIAGATRKTAQRQVWPSPQRGSAA